MWPLNMILLLIGILIVIPIMNKLEERSIKKHGFKEEE